MDIAFILTSFVTLFVVIDPIGMAPIFVALTQGLDKVQRRQVAARACLVASAILIAFAIFGDQVLGFAGISMPAFRIAGGILLFLTALEMLFERRSKRREGQADDTDHDDPSVFPLAIPLLAGPGAITTVILLIGQRADVLGTITIIGVMLALIFMVFLMFLAAPIFDRLLGKTGIIVVTRLLGMLLAALAVQFIVDGASTALNQLIN